MLKVVLVEKGVAQKELFFDADEVFIGRTANNGISLPKPNVSKRHAVIRVQDGRVIVDDLKSTNGTWVGGRKIDQAQQLKEKDFIFIGDYAIGVAIVDPDAPAVVEEPSREVPLEPQPATVAMPAVNPADLPPPVLPPDFMPPPLPEDSVVDAVPEKAAAEPVAPVVPPVVPEPVEFEVEVELDEPVAAPEPVKAAPAPKQAKVAKPARDDAPPPPPAAEPVSTVSGLARRLGYGAETDRHAAMRALAEVAGREVFAGIDPGKADFSDAEWLKLSDGVMRIVDRLRRENRISSDADPVEMTQQVLFEFAGLGPLEELLSSQTVRAIIVNGLESIQVIDCGGSRAIDAVFSNWSTFDRVVTKLCILAGMAPGSKDDPLVEGHLPDGSLLQIIGRPYVQDGRMIVIERPVTRLMTADELVSEAGANQDVIQAIQSAVSGRRNIIVCGAPYTTRCVIINSLTAMIGPDRRVLILGGGPESVVTMPNHVAMGRSAVLESAPGCARMVGRVFPDHVVVNHVESTDACLVRELGLAGFGGMILGMVANSAEDCVDRLRLMLQFSTPGIELSAVDALIARLAQTVVVLGLRDDGHTVILDVYENDPGQHQHLLFDSNCRWTTGWRPGLAGAAPEAAGETELTVESPTGPATDPGVTPSEIAIEVQSE